MFDLTKCFTAARFPEGAARRKMMKRVEKLNTAVAALKAQCIEASKKYGITIRKSSVGGRGVFTKKAIPRGAVIMLYQCTYVPEERLTKDCSYVYNLGPMPVDAKKKIVMNVSMDGKPHTAPRKPEELLNIQGALLNHACRPKTNVIGHWEYCNAAELHYIYYKTARSIPANSELFINYNDSGKQKLYGDKYWSRYATLVANNVPARRIVRCKCNARVSGRGCPNNYAFDKRDMYKTK
jgi:hypothetical protein